MIKNINTSSPWLTVQNPYRPSIYNYNPNDPCAHFIGSVRYNPGTQNLEAWDGSIWVGIASSVSVEPSSQMCQVLEWAQEKMWQDQRIRELVETNPTVADAHATYVQAAEQLAIVAKLVQP